MTGESLRALYGEPSDLVRRKAIDHLDRHCRAFIALSPFLVVGTAGADRAADVSPRGDAPGFVKVIDAHRLAIPDRPGNRRIDTLRNVAENPDVALIFFVPGVNETLRVNGAASISTEAALLAGFAVEGRLPKTAMVVRVREAFLHCAKALIRSRLWDVSMQVERGALPSLGTMIADQVGGVDAREADTRIDAAYKTTLY